MYTELYYHTIREDRELEVAQKMAERRNHSVAATRRSPLGAILARMLFAPSVTAEGSEVGGRA